MTQQQYIIQRKVGLVELGKALGNISEACRKIGSSRQHYYDIKRTIEEEGIEGLVEKTRRMPRYANRVAEEIEKKILEYCLEYPTHGKTRVQNELLKRGVEVSAGGIQGVWNRHNLRTKGDRLKRLEKWALEEKKILTESQVQALETVKEEKEAHGEIETYHPGFLVGQDTFYAAWVKGIGKIYQQTGIDTYSNVAWAKLYTEKTALTAADFLNDKVQPFFESYGIRLLRTLTDRGTEYCGTMEHHPYQLYLYLNDIEHTRTKAKHPQTNGLCEKMNQILLEEFWQVAFRKKLYRTLEEIQRDLDEWLYDYNNRRTNQGKRCQGRTPMETFIEALPLCERYIRDLPVNAHENDAQKCPINDSLEVSRGIGTPIFENKENFSVEVVH